MGDVKEAVKGSSKISPKLLEGNLVQKTGAIIDELDGLIQKKDEDAMSEGKDKQPENVAKAARLRSALTLVRAAKVLLEDY